MDANPPIGFRLSVLHRAIKKQIDEYLREEGLTGTQLFVLAKLRELEMSDTEEVNQRDLENSCHVTHPTMTGIIQRLEAKGYITCSQSRHDRRYKAIASTESAIGLKQRMDELDRLCFSGLCKGLTQEQIDSFVEISAVMTRNAITACKKGCENPSDKETGKEPEGV